MIISIYIYWVPVQISLKLAFICTIPLSFVSNIHGSYEKRSRYNVLPLVTVEIYACKLSVDSSLELEYLHIDEDQIALLIQDLVTQHHSFY